jgi:hypothetical protein
MSITDLEHMGQQYLSHTPSRVNITKEIMLYKRNNCQIVSNILTCHALSSHGNIHNALCGHIS